MQGARDYGTPAVDGYLRILHLEDEPDFCELVKDLLRKDGLLVDVVRVDNLGDLVATLENSQFDIILGDYHLPTCTGIQALAEAHQRCPDTPFVLVSGVIGEQAAIEALKCGAADYVLKQWPERIAPAVRRAVRETKSRRSQKRAEDTLRQLAEIIECADDAIISKDLDGTVRTWNPAAERLFGYRAEEIIGQNITLIIPESHKAEEADILEKVRKGERVRHYEAIRLKKDGTALVVSLTISPVRDASRRIVGASKIVRDITGRKRAETHLRLLSTALEATANAVVITDREGVIVWVNSAFSQLTGYSFQEACGQKTSLLKSGTHAREFYRNLWNTISAGKVWSAEMINRRKDGSLYTEESTITPVRDEQGTITHFIGVKQDITERRRLEEQLRQSLKMEGIGQLAGGVAHDFNNMLAIIRGNAELMLMDADQLSPEANQGLKHVISAAERAANLTRQLLIFSRKQVMQSQPTMLDDLIRNLIKMLQRVIREDIRLECVFEKESSCVQADAGMIEQVLLNLVVNARDAMPQGGQVRIATEKVVLDEEAARGNPQGRAGDFVCLSVSDTGTGIAPEHLARIFDPFFTTKDVGRGTGLGLAVCYGILSDHGGRLDVRSTLGVGTTFTITLPVATD
jgi:PAS domain S-box-containing protein